MSDLVDILRDRTRLRAKHGLTGWVLHEESLRAKAADEIDALRAENARLRAALEAAPTPDIAESNIVYDDWYNTWRREALDGSI